MESSLKILIMLSNTHKKIQKPHDNHEKVDTKIKLMAKMRERAQSETTSIRQIIDEETVVSDAGLEIDFAAEESRLQHARRVVNPTLPNTIDEFAEILESSNYSMVRGQQFYRTTLSSENGHKASIFIYEPILEKLKNSQEIFFDGTFKTCPAMFYQHFVVFFKYMGHVFPGAYILMSNKSEEIYCAVFEYLRGLEISPHTIISDWEQASRNAASRIWQSAELKGCFFHYTSAVQKKLRKMHLSSEFDNPRS